MMLRRSFLCGLPLLAARDTPTRQAKVVKLFKSPDGHPNALESTKDGLWIGEQLTDNAYLVDWKGKVIQRVATESSNTSGIAFGGGSLWMGTNGKATRRPPRPADGTTGEVVEVDPNTGKTKSRHPVPGGGGLHGLEYVEPEGALWMTSLKIQKLSKVNPKTFELLHQIPVHLGRAHGLAFVPPNAIWCMHSTDRVVHKLDTRDGALLEVVRLAPTDPDPHGMCMHMGHLYYCDAGFVQGGGSNGSAWAGYICRIDLA